MATQSPPAWHPDPDEPDLFLRYWDGASWTEQRVARPPAVHTPSPKERVRAVLTRWNRAWVGFVGCLSLLLLVGMCSGGSSTPEPEPGPEPVAETDAPVEPDLRQQRIDRRTERRLERIKERQARQAAQLEQQMTAAAKSACEGQDGDPTVVVTQAQQVTIRCEVADYIALIGWDGGDDVHWTRWWRMGTKPARVLAGAFSRSAPARVPAPPPPPAPAPVAPAPAPAPAAPQGPPGYPFTGNNGYTGPRCYAPGGVWWKPC